MNTKTLQERIETLEVNMQNISKTLDNQSLNHANDITMIATFIKALIKENHLSKEKTLSLLPENCPDEMKDWISYYFDVK